MRRAALLLGLAGIALPASTPAATLRVPLDYPAIQPAVDAAAAGDTVLVAPGTYTDATTRLVYIGGAGPITVTSGIILKDGVSVISEAGSASTTIDTSDALVVGRGWVVVGGLLASGTRVQGFVLVGPAQWGAVHVQDSGVITFEDCVFEDFTSTIRSGGILAVEADLLIRECVFERCTGTGGGAVRVTAGALAIQDSRFEACHATEYEGGAVMFEVDEFSGGQSLHVSGCTFVGNTAPTANVGGGALGIGTTNSAAPVTIENSVFLDNEVATLGGAISLYGGSGGAVLISGNVFARNRVNGGVLYSGGGAVFAGGAITMQGNTFFENSQGSPASVFPGSAAYVDGSIAMDHNIFAGSSGAPAVGMAGGAVFISNGCNVYWENQDGNTSGFALDPTDREANPLFCAPESDDFTLAADSPCLDEGSTECGQVGALGQGCGPISIDALSWGRVKAGYVGEGR